MDNQQRSEWVRGSAALLEAPAAWEPDLRAAHTRFDDRLYRRERSKRRLRFVAAAVMAACLVVPLIPAGRVLAQDAAVTGWNRLERLWYWFTVLRPGPLRVLLFRLPDQVKHLREHPRQPAAAPQQFVDVAAAARAAGFALHLPSSLAASPRLTLQHAQVFEMLVSTAELEQALARARVSDVEVPADWDGTRLSLQVGATLTAEWSGMAGEWSDMTLLQCQTPAIETPPGFDVARYVAVNLRAAALSRDHAAQFAQRSSTGPALLLFGGLRYFAGIREIGLRDGPATLIEEFSGDKGNIIPQVHHVSLLWSVGNRLYFLRGGLTGVAEDGRPQPQLGPHLMSTDLAGAIGNLIALANTIE